MMLNKIGTHMAVTFAKPVVTNFFNQPLKYSIWQGCSRGGIQGIEIMEQYPNDFQGVISGAAGAGKSFNLQVLQGAMIRQQQFMGGLQNPVLDLSKEQLVENYIISECDRLDGVIDNTISDPVACSRTVTLQKMQNNLKLNSAQMSYIKMLLNNSRITDGPSANFVNVGYLSDFPFVDFNSRDMSLYTEATKRVFGITVTDVYNLDIAEATAKYIADLADGRTISSSANLSPFVYAGGKAIIWHGSRDNLINAAASIEYYQRVRLTAGNSLQFYLAPGVNHCAVDRPTDPMAGLDVFTSLDKTEVLKQMEKWIETGVAPTQIKTVSLDQSVARPWCPYPLIATKINPNLPDPNYNNYKCTFGASSLNPPRK